MAVEQALDLLQVLGGYDRGAAGVREVDVRTSPLRQSVQACEGQGQLDHVKRFESGLRVLLSATPVRDHVVSLASMEHQVCARLTCGDHLCTVTSLSLRRRVVYLF